MGMATGNSPWLLSMGLNPNGGRGASGEEQKSNLRAEIPNPSSTVSWDHGRSREGQVSPKEAVKAGCALGPGGRRRGVSGERSDPVQGTKSIWLERILVLGKNEKSPEGRRQALRLYPAGDGKPLSLQHSVRKMG